MALESKIDEDGNVLVSLNGKRGFCITADRLNRSQVADLICVVVDCCNELLKLDEVQPEGE